MAIVTNLRLQQVVNLLWQGIYEESFRGKIRGRFAITREQLRAALKTERLHATTVQALQDLALSSGLVIVDLDDLFACVETEVVRGYRRPTVSLFEKLVAEYVVATPEEENASSVEDSDDES